MSRVLTLDLALGLALAAPATARRGTDVLKRYCSGDAVTFCGDLDPGGKEMKACFIRHRAELSKGCGRAIDAYRAKGGR